MSMFPEETFLDPYEFLRALRRSESRWCNEAEDHSRWVFRGQANADWVLKPSGFRESPVPDLLAYYLEHIKELTVTVDRLKWTGSKFRRPSHIPKAEWLGRLERVNILALAQAALVRDFVSIASSARHPVKFPISLYQLWMTSRRGLMSNLVLYISGELLSLLDLEGYDAAVLFAIAQHHGVPTALLDWTWNPMIAAYFAAEGVALGKSGGATEIAVYAVHEDVIVFDEHISRITVPPGVVPFLDAQEGLFLWCPTYFRKFLRSGTFMTFDDLFKETAEKINSRPLDTKIRCLKLPVGQAPELLKILWRDNISPAHLRPTFDHVTRALEVRKVWREA
jgi:hypothetical protein